MSNDEVSFNLLAAVPVFDKEAACDNEQFTSTIMSSKARCFPSSCTQTLLCCSPAHGETCLHQQDRHARAGAQPCNKTALCETPQFLLRFRAWKQRMRTLTKCRVCSVRWSQQVTLPIPRRSVSLLLVWPLPPQPAPLSGAPLHLLKISRICSSFSAPIVLPNSSSSLT